MGRWVAIAVAVLVVVGGASDQPGRAASTLNGLTISVSGPAQGMSFQRYQVSVTIANERTDGQAATGLVLSDVAQPFDISMETQGPTDCYGGCTSDQIRLRDIPAGASATVTFSYQPNGYGTHTHAYAVTSRVPSMGASASYSIAIAVPDNFTDWRLQVTPAVGLGGLVGRYQVVATNLGPATAAAVVVSTDLTPRERLISAQASQGSCSSRETTSRIVVRCEVGSIGPNGSVTVTIETKLPPNPSGADHAGAVSSTTDALDLSHTSGSGPSLFPRYWLCEVCASTIFPDGYVLPSTFTVGDDDVVHISDGSIIRRDGWLVRADGKLFQPDGTLYVPPPTPLEMKLAVSVSSDHPSLGDTLVYTFVLTRTGNRPSSTEFRALLPTGQDLRDATPINTCGGWPVTCYLMWAQGQQSQTVAIRARVIGYGEQTMRASLVASDETGDAGDDAVIAVVRVDPANEPGTTTSATQTQPTAVSQTKPQQPPAATRPAPLVTSGTVNADTIRGTSAGDRIGGGRGNDTLSGGSGADRIVGGPGRDRISGGPGNDTILARDRERDTIWCGSGRDTVDADRIDVVARDCERVRRR